jgi:hypothetical protein
MEHPFPRRSFDKYRNGIFLNCQDLASFRFIPPHKNNLGGSWVKDRREARRNDTAFHHRQISTQTAANDGIDLASRIAVVKREHLQTQTDARRKLLLRSKHSLRVRNSRSSNMTMIKSQPGTRIFTVPG